MILLISSRSPLRRRPSIVASPEVGRRSPVSILMVVLLPAPFGPRKPKNRPRATRKERRVDGGLLRGRPWSGPRRRWRGRRRPSTPADPWAAAGARGRVRPSTGAMTRSSPISGFELLGVEALGAVGEGLLGVVVDLDQQAVGSGGDGRARHRRSPCRGGPCRGSGPRRSGDGSASSPPGWPRCRGCCAWRSRTCGCRARRGSPACCPPARMYSAESSHSSMVAERPRFRRTGRRTRPSSFRRSKFCMLRAPDLEAVHVAQHHVEGAHVHHLADDGQAQGVGRLAHPAQGLLAVPLEGVGRRPRLEGAARAARGRPAARTGAGHASPTCSRRLDRAGARHDDDLGARPRATPATSTTVSVGLNVRPDELVGLRDLDDLAHAREELEGARVHDLARHRPPRPGPCG